MYTTGMNPIMRERVLGQMPAKRYGTPEEIADAAAFLGENEYTSNCTIDLD